MRFLGVASKALAWITCGYKYFGITGMPKWCEFEAVKCDIFMLEMGIRLHQRS